MYVSWACHTPFQSSGEPPPRRGKASFSSLASSRRERPLPGATGHLDLNPSPALARRLRCIRRTSESQKPATRSESSALPASYLRRFASSVSTSCARVTCLNISSADSLSSSGSDAQRSGCHRIACRRNARLMSERGAFRATPRIAYGSRFCVARTSSSITSRNRSSASSGDESRSAASSAAVAPEARRAASSPRSACSAPSRTR
mmetsp:Transcript_36268/g.121480  ORF Transcript_36268/g.121480 Transcript_36268/m.121480 type:complete len:205 (+) Transcript_36268:114-728(+)